MQLTVLDGIEELERKVVNDGVSYENLQFSSTTDLADSLLHTLARTATQTTVRNYVANSSFENATIANSWTVSGTGSTLTRAAGGLFGSFQGDWLLASSGTATVIQDVLFAGDKKLNIGETWTWTIYALSTSTIADFDIILEERDASTSNGSTTTQGSLTANANWVRLTVSHTITDAATDRFRVTLQSTTNSLTASIDAAMLTQTREALNWFVLNDNDGASGEEDADDADSASYDTVGFDVDRVSQVHPWVLLEKYDSPWTHLKKLSVASLGQYLGMDAAGTLKFRARRATGYADPTPLETIEEPTAVGSVLEEQAANAIIMRGTKIQKQQHVYEVWRATASGVFLTTAFSGRLLHETVTTGANWPSTTLYPQYYAKYDDTID